LRKIIIITTVIVVLILIFLSTILYFTFRSPDDGRSYPSIFKRCEGINLEKIRLRNVSLPIDNCLEGFNVVYAMNGIKKSLANFEEVSNISMNYADSLIFQGDFPFVIRFHPYNYYDLRGPQCTIRLRGDAEIAENQISCVAKSIHKQYNLRSEVLNEG